MWQPRPFGKYLLLERISVGGMAEVFTAKAFGAEGFEKILAIKRILPSMVEDDDFIRMFIDEAKIAGQLSHANIGQLFELGRIDDSHFIAMEYVWGKDLLQLQNRLRQLKRKLPWEAATYIASKVCDGLDYAHRKRDANGEPLNIVHRDVSPQNVLVSYEGDVKIIDFGIAKAVNNSTTTQAGVLKGKFSYMSPEQVLGKAIDRRSDLFAIGTTLFELCTGERLFTGESDYAILDKVRKALVPSPRVFNPNLPHELERIVLKSLKLNASERYQSASEFQEALMGLLQREGKSYSGSQLSLLMRELFEQEIERERAKLDEYRRLRYDDGLQSLIAAVLPDTEQAAETKATNVTPVVSVPEKVFSEFVGNTASRSYSTVPLGAHSEDTLDDQEPTLFDDPQRKLTVEQGPFEKSAVDTIEDEEGETSVMPEHTAPNSEDSIIETPPLPRFSGTLYETSSSQSQDVTPLNVPQRLPESSVITARDLVASVAKEIVPNVNVVFPPAEPALPAKRSWSKEIAISVLAILVLGLTVALLLVKGPSTETLPPTALVISTTLPEAAKIRVNGEIVGEMTPGEPFVVRDLSPGEHHVALTLPNEETIVRKVNIVAGDVQLMTVEIEAKPTILQTPDERSNERPSEKKPVDRERPQERPQPPKETPQQTSETASPSKNTMVSTKQANVASSSEVTMKPKEDDQAPEKIPPRKPNRISAPRRATNTVSTQKPASTNAEPGYLVANTVPWAKVLIDGKDTGRTTPIPPRTKLALSPGPHTVTFVTDQGRYDYQIVIQAGEITKLIKTPLPHK